jgi:hypothetical protein
LPGAADDDVAPNADVMCVPVVVGLRDVLNDRKAVAGSILDRERNADLVDGLSRTLAGFYPG